MGQPPQGARRTVAVVGAGVAGLTAAWVLRREFEVTLYEADARLGGHADTHQVRVGGRAVPVDTGFIVHNDRTYPTLLRLFGELGVATQDTDMSMSVRCGGCGLEYAGGKRLPGLLPSASTALRGRYLRMLTEVRHFHRAAKVLLESGEGAGDLTLREFLEHLNFSDYFTQHFMTPLVSAVWSCDSALALDYPARHLFTFLDHHGMLTVTGSPTWRTVTGGSVEYVKRVAAQLPEVRAGHPVRALHHFADRVEVRDDADEVRVFDAAVVATHPDQALKLLAEPTPMQQQVLGDMPYSANVALLHTDESLLPTRARARASWNYRMASCADQSSQVLVSYDMTRLQRLDEGPAGPLGRRYVVTLGGEHLVDPSAVLDRMEYAHPQFTPDSVAAQRLLPQLNSPRLAFAGAYHGWGFHEDGALSGLRAAEALGARW